MNRKDEHISLAKAFHKEKTNDFDQIRFVHHSFSEIAMDEVDISTSFLDFSFKQPFYINAMTGGSKRAKEINQELGIIARETGIMTATGSVNAALKNPDLADTYQIMRKENPNGVIWANIGAGLSLEDAKRAVDLFQADGLQIHVNTPQELVMPEGDRDFHGWLDTIEDIVAHLSVPVLVKEVGFGMSSETIEQLICRGVKLVDISGQGGTSFTQIENARRKKRELGFLTDWGQSTVLSLLESTDWQKELTILASGGIRQSMDIIKALSLGAASVGVAGTILNYLMTNSVDETIELIQQWEDELKMMYTLLGKKTTADLATTDIIFSGEIIHWCESRGIAYQPFAKRSK
ncbi:type 2 isopentenyl-diphosphate Delta-isomerase [Enterococcus ureilyticus]|uniref:Isopentenyl-diphosphate delta-isomerase n=1 Tax=Enterococcus ureilyticus TaxID=1131292 RepID=A0A1E5HEK9_9ENTE|nr:type 2 isopentenyl-diphosphate Delta-isomerase [Enterococcus ureilyticus]MBM7689621.1 isopentenyl-diphosphate delta-isomerase [Enterococcus ureilyticus]MBO0444813.1 type 2 isopentenyl-diphosphate Delta-isomerase [Enterococcus ureilyticus]OEG23369.1 type 2 isopentenyl-diphosphate Delta-isomerase [Enterococcus ureilyticus]